jgi:hypothetical protein
LAFSSIFYFENSNIRLGFFLKNTKNSFEIHKNHSYPIWGRPTQKKAWAILRQNTEFSAKRSPRIKSEKTLANWHIRKK